ncbi:MAG TPA: thioesterase family protein [Fibrobacteraceae bacterium]|nr:thioesterase family protein [Fibrobacteraceae bacterium]
MFSSQTTIEVRYAETDAMGVVHHSVYAVWFEQARVQGLRTQGLPYQDIEAQGYSLPVVRLEVEYLKPARFGDIVTVSMHLSKEGASRFRFDYEVHCGVDLLVRGKTLHGFTRQGKACRPPQEFLRILDKLIN